MADAWAGLWVSCAVWGHRCDFLHKTRDRALSIGSSSRCRPRRLLPTALGHAFKTLHPLHLHAAGFHNTLCTITVFVSGAEGRSSKPGSCERWSACSPANHTPQQPLSVPIPTHFRTTHCNRRVDVFRLCFVFSCHTFVTNIGRASRERSGAREGGDAASGCLSQTVRREAPQHEESRRADGDTGKLWNVSRPAKRVACLRTVL